VKVASGDNALVMLQNVHVLHRKT